MEFLYKLYSNNYFGIGLFIIITLLAFTFLVILFFGKKDEKARMNQVKEESLAPKEEILNENVDLEPINLNETIALQEEKQSEENVSSIDLEEESIFNKVPIMEEQPLKSVEEPVYYKETPKEEVDSFVTSNIVLNTDYINEEPSLTLEESDEFSKASDIYNLDSIMNEEVISVQEETFDDVLSKYDAIEETIMKESNVETSDLPEENTPVIEEKEEVDVFSKPGENKKTSTPFSSVYLTKEEASTNAEEVVEETKPIVPNRPTFELPKKVDLPKRSASAINENIISSLQEENRENRKQ